MYGGPDMANPQKEQFGWQNKDFSDYSYAMDPGGSNFGQEQQFVSFDYAQQGHVPDTGPAALYPPSQYYSQQDPYILNPATARYKPVAKQNADDEFENEPPLLEELGINFEHIRQKTVAVLNPLKSTSASILNDTDLAGPLVFGLAFGGFLLLSGKVHFGYIYGIGLMGCVSMYFLLNVMSLPGISLGATLSVLGYCLLPMAILAGFSVVFSLKGIGGSILAFVTVLWCAFSASKLFVTALTMEKQQPLVAYPCALLYGVFALLTMF